jgi:YD repeat-containing protein
MTYDGNENLVESILPNGARSILSYDAYDRVIREQFITEDSSSLTSYTYDDNGNLITQNRDATLTSFDYDLFDRLISTTDSLGNISYNSYDKM